MKAQYIVFVLTSVVSVNFLAEGYKVTCYMCNNLVENCPAEAPPETMRTQDFYLGKSHTRRRMFPACRKEVYTNTTNHPPTVWVVRDNVDLPNADGDSCESGVGAPGIKWRKCWCTGNYCNGSSSNSPMSQIIVALCALGAYARKLFSS